MNRTQPDAQTSQYLVDLAQGSSDPDLLARLYWETRTGSEGSDALTAARFASALVDTSRSPEQVIDDLRAQCEYHQALLEPGEHFADGEVSAVNLSERPVWVAVGFLQHLVVTFAHGGLSLVIDDEASVAARHSADGKMVWTVDSTGGGKGAWRSFYEAVGYPADDEEGSAGTTLLIPRVCSRTRIASQHQMRSDTYRAIVRRLLGFFTRDVTPEMIATMLATLDRVIVETTKDLRISIAARSAQLAPVEEWQREGSARLRALLAQVTGDSPSVTSFVSGSDRVRVCDVSPVGPDGHAEVYPDAPVVAILKPAMSDRAAFLGSRPMPGRRCPVEHAVHGEWSNIATGTHLPDLASAALWLFLLPAPAGAKSDYFNGLTPSLEFDPSVAQCRSFMLLQGGMRSAARFSGKTAKAELEKAARAAVKAALLEIDFHREHGVGLSAILTDQIDWEDIDHVIVALPTEASYAQYVQDGVPPTWALNIRNALAERGVGFSLRPPVTV